MAEVVSGYLEDIDRVCRQPLPWDRLSGCNILVTGATGLIGGCLVDILMRNSARDYHVFAAGRNRRRAMLRFAPYASDDAFRFIEYDVCRPLECDEEFHYIIHAASGSGPAAFASDPVGVMRANLYGTDNLLTYGEAHGMRRFVYVSSGEVYGQGGGRPFTETDSGYVDCATPRACYPSSKRAAETLCVCHAAQYGADAVIVRPCHTYGPYFTESDNRVFAQFIRNVLAGEDIIMKSDGRQFRSWCYVVDCASAILFVMLKGSCGEAYNIADGSSCFSIRDMAESIAGTEGRKVVTRLPDNEEKRGYTKIDYAVFDTSKLEALGWRVAGTWREKMAATIRQQREYMKTTAQ